MKDQMCLSPTEVCKELGISRTKLYAMLKVKAIPNLRVGRRILIPVRELEEWIHQSTLIEQNGGDENG